MKIGISATPAHQKAKESVVTLLKEQGFDVIDFSGNDIITMSCEMSNSVINQKIDKGIIIDDYGYTPFMVCSKHHKIVCAQVADEHSAKMTRGHNNTSIITIGANVTGIELLKSISLIFAKTDYDAGRHQVRVDMLDAMC